MKRVLFVDDEQVVLDAMQRLLVQMDDQWEMAFAPRGEEALMLLDATPFDVIVSDLRMPGIDGEELLKTVCQRHPGVVRIVPSSQMELAAALRAVPVAHQFLLRLSDPNMLRVAVERATSLSSVLNNKLLESMSLPCRTCRRCRERILR